jgi:hypothetical protein
VIISLDDEARQLFNTAARAILRIQKIVWTNPTAQEENCISWLENGAKSEVRRCLGFS